MPLTRAAQARRTETPNAVMTTLASPTVGGTTSIALWRVEMMPGSSGPEHAFDAEQAWTVLSGSAEITVDGEATAIAAGDTLVIPRDAVRRVVATGALEAVVAGRAGTTVTAAGREASTPPWVA